jgi:HD-GYP domain-containing protein (c-di-GMP phosphodiesterase class II)
VSSADLPEPVAEIVYQHHERLDGSGYPRGLKTPELLMGSQVLMVADVVEAMCTHRPYRPAFGIDAALEAITAGSGTLYDADVVEACRAVVREGFVFVDQF